MSNPHYSAAKADDAAEALAKAVEEVKHHFPFESKYTPVTNRERALDNLWKCLAIYRRVTR